MKNMFTFPALVLAVVTPTVFSQTQTTAPLPTGQAAGVSPSASARYQVIARGPNSRVWQKIEYQTMPDGRQVPQIHKYTELGAGLCRKDGHGNFVDASEEITILPDGTAAATNMESPIYFPSDIAQGVIRFITPEGRQLQTGPAFLDFDDGTNLVVIGSVTNSVGELISSNQVLYPNILRGSGFRVDLLCTVRRSGFESCLVFREKIPDPTSLGLGPNARLQLLTEFFNPPEPEQTASAVSRTDGLADSTLRFGSTVMGRGKAFVAGSQESERGGQTPVYKSWLHLQRRTFLMEELPYQRIRAQLQTLPAPTASGSAVSHLPSVIFASAKRPSPPAREIAPSKSQIQFASANLNRHPGVVLDYNYTVVDSDQTDFTFQSGQTYFISDLINLYGTTIFKEGTVIKFLNYGNANIWLQGPIVCDTSLERPALFTSMNDDSIGEIIDGSSGSPAFVYWQFYLIDEYGVPSYKGMRFSYAGVAISPIVDIDCRDCQFVHCNAAVYFWAGANLHLHNVLVAHCNMVDGDDSCDDSGNNVIDAENLTADDCSTLVFTCGGVQPGYTLTNSLLSATPLPNFADPSNLVNSAVIGNSTEIYQTAGRANYYLAVSSPYRNVGTTNVNPDLLAELQTMTTYAPQDGGWPDTNAPDLGYHYPVNEDSDYDGLPDWWEWKYFGTYTYSGTNLDSQGNTLLSDYQSGRDPNVISFSLSSTNNYVNTRTVGIQASVTGSIPYYQAVLVDDTNFADATWTAYASSNLIVNLGATDGWHQIWIGLKGLPDEATKTWVWKRLKLDRTPPLLVITNPVSATVMQPMIELQGYSPEELADISFDLTNAAGLCTNRQVLVLDRHYDTNTWEFTTNTFQGFDIPLTNGVNTLTLHATDLAGNATNLTLSYTLDYSGKTNPPVVQLYWPQDGAQICGSSFTWRGRVDDFTAQLTAQIVDASGNTNAVNALVERDGDFWAENLSLSAGANELTLTATDAAGNVSITNITVAQSTVTLIMNDVPSDQLWNATVTVYGSINDANDYTVWVNGVKATLNGDSWEADNVPNTPGGTAVFQARAIPNTDNGGNGSGGSGGASASYTNPGNPDSADAKDADSQTDKPMRLYVESYSYSEHSEIHPSGAGYNSDGQQTYSFQLDDAHTWTLNWADGSGGTGSHDNNGDTTLSGTVGGDVSSYTYSAADQWPASVWPDLVDGTGTINTTVTYNGQTLGSSWSGEVDPPHVGENGWPTIAYEHCQEQGPSSGSGSCSDGHGGYITSQDNVTYTRTADTVMKLFTGGKAGANRQNIFAVSATAQRPLWMRMVPNLLSDLCWWEYELPPLWGLWVGIDPTQITIDNQAQDANGVAYFKWPDGVTKVLTPKTGADYYTFDPPPTAGKHTLVHATACTALGNANDSRTTIGIGEKVGFWGMPPNTVWTVSGKGSIASTSGGGTSSGSVTNDSVMFTANLSPGSATVKATVGGETISTPLTILAPDSIKVIGQTDVPFGPQNPNGTKTGAETDYAIVVTPTTVSFAYVIFGEEPDAGQDVTWPDGIVRLEKADTTDQSTVGCDNTWPAPGDRISSPIGGVSIDRLWNGSGYADCSWTNIWHDRYKNDAGDWVNFCQMNAKIQFFGSTLKCQVTYQSIPGSAQGPY